MGAQMLSVDELCLASLVFKNNHVAFGHTYTQYACICIRIYIYTPI